MENNVKLKSPHTINTHHQLKLAQQIKHINILISTTDWCSASDLLIDLHYADLADYLDNLNNKKYNNIFACIADRINPRVLLCLSNANKEPAIKALGAHRSAELLSQLTIEDSIEILEAIHPSLKEKILDNTNPERKQQIIEGFQYPENTAGRALEKDFVSLKQHWNVGQAIDYIKRSSITGDFHAAIVTDNLFQPIGTILLNKLIKSPKHVPLSEIMEKKLIVVNPDTEIHEVAFMFKQYSLTIVPIINKDGKLIGSISLDNMLYIIEAKTETEILNLGGVNNSDIFYNLYISAKNRFPWLFMNLITACITSMIINQFDETISKLVTLAVIMPIVASMGGNAGTQAMTVTVRAISNREINHLNSFRVVVKEIYTCILNGLVLSIIGGAAIYTLFKQIDLSSVFAFSILINFTIAGFLGSSIPIFLNRMDIDPAAASGVFLTACTDAIGFFVFLGMGYFFLI